MPNKPNILLITADDLNWNSVGAYGCTTPACTPNIDALANDGIRFDYAHVTIAVCQPSRGALMTGRYPHKSGQEGFHYINHTTFPLLPEILREAGYLNGILGKAWHSTPRQNFRWDLIEDMKELGWGRDCELYHKFTKQFLDMSKNEDKPFFLMLNSHDPHRPFHGNDEGLKGKHGVSYPEPSRVYQDHEVEVPGFLPDIPDVRKEIAEYSSSIRRCDDTVGRVVDALKETGQYENTLIMFISDNGMAFPLSKTNCYLHSTKTPLIVTWPEVVRQSRVDEDHFINGIDFLATAVEAAGGDLPSEIDGKSFLNVIRGEADNSRTQVFTQFHETAAGKRYPMRCVQDKEFGYIFNPWSDGERLFQNESQSGRTFKAMKAEGENDSAIEKRVNLFEYRVVEELYDFKNDPDAKVNLISNPKYREELAKLQDSLEAWMIEHKDLALEAFRNRHSKEALAKFMEEQKAHREILCETGKNIPDGMEVFVKHVN